MAGSEGPEKNLQAEMNAKMFQINKVLTQTD